MMHVLMARSPLQTLLFLIFIQLSAFLSAQGGVNTLTDLQILRSTTNKFEQAQLEIGDIEGSPYIDETFQEGKVFMLNTLHEGLLLRYNAYHDLFEANLGSSTIVIDPLTNPIDTIYYRDYKFVRKILPQTERIIVYMAVLYQNQQVQLYKKYNVRFVQATQPSSYKEATPASFDPTQPDYYLGRDDNLILLRGIRSLATFFNVEQKEVKSFIRSGQLNLKDEADLVIICRHFSD